MSTKSLIESSYLARYLLFNAVDITDYKIFPERDIQNSPPVFHYADSGSEDTLLPILNRKIIRVCVNRHRFT